MHKNAYGAKRGQELHSKSVSSENGVVLVPCLEMSYLFKEELPQSLPVQGIFFELNLDLLGRAYLLLSLPHLLEEGVVQCLVN